MTNASMTTPLRPRGTNDPHAECHPWGHTAVAPLPAPLPGPSSRRRTTLATSWRGLAPTSASGGFTARAPRGRRCTPRLSRMLRIALENDRSVSSAISRSECPSAYCSRTNATSWSSKLGLGRDVAVSRNCGKGQRSKLRSRWVRHRHPFSICSLTAALNKADRRCSPGERRRQAHR